MQGHNIHVIPHHFPSLARVADLPVVNGLPEALDVACCRVECLDLLEGRLCDTEELLQLADAFPLLAESTCLGQQLVREGQRLRACRVGIGKAARQPWGLADFPWCAGPT